MLTCPRSFCGLLGSEATEPSRDIGIYRQKTQKNIKDEMPSYQKNYNNCSRYAAHAYKLTRKDNKSNNNSYQEQQQQEGVDENTWRNIIANQICKKKYHIFRIFLKLIILTKQFKD